MAYFFQRNLYGSHQIVQTGAEASSFPKIAELQARPQRKNCTGP